MFCPNCGAPNPDTATTCQKCGFNVKGTASPKFKGTMLMMNAQGGPPGVPNPGVTPPMPVGVPVPGAPGQQGAPGQVAPVEVPNSKLKGTMIGVAPPSLGAVKPPSGGTQPSPVAAPYAGVAAPAGVAPVAVNPLESTMAADAGMLSPFAQGGPFAQGAQFGHPAPGPVHQPGPAASGPAAFSPAGGGVPPTQPGAELQSYGPPPAASYGGHPAPHSPQVVAQPGMPPGALPYGSAPYGAPGSAPYGALVAGPGGMGGAPAGSAGFTQRSPVGLFFLTLVTCGIYAYFWYAGTAKEMEAKGATIGPWWYLLIPILNIIWIWKWCQGLDQVSQGQLSAGTNLLKLFFLGLIGMAWLQSSINKL